MDNNRFLEFLAVTYGEHLMNQSIFSVGNYGTSTNVLMYPLAMHKFETIPPCSMVVQPNVHLCHPTHCGCLTVFLSQVMRARYFGYQ